MDFIESEIVAFLQYLIPGLLCAWVFYGLTAFQKPSQFERLVQALIFTLLVQAITFLYKKIALFIGEFLSLGRWDKDIELVTSAVMAVLVGLVFSYFTNNGKLHAIFRNLKITKENPYRSEWIHEFINRETHILLHLNDGRRICGWPNGWPPNSDTGHFALSDAAWWSASEADEITEHVLKRTAVILINVKDVSMVEFLTDNSECKNDK